MNNTNNNGVLAAYHLTGDGSGHTLEWPEVQDWKADEGFLWLHLDFTQSDVPKWLYEESGLEETICDALVAEETRPRTLITKEGLLVILRGVNMNPGADPEDMVSIRLWIGGDRVISTRMRRLMSVDALKADIANQQGPSSPGELLVMLSTHMINRMTEVMADIDEQLDTLESEGLESSNYQLRSDLATIRREIIGLRRYLSPQREALNQLIFQRNEFISEQARGELRESTDLLIRYVEDLDAMRERATLLQEEIVNRLTENMNQRMYILSLVAGIFLPLGFITGLLGINVGGIPGTENVHAFEYVVIICVVLIVAGYLAFKRQKWL